MSRRIQVIKTAASLAALLCSTALVFGQSGRDVRFSHRLHIENVGAECLDCHGTTPDAVELSVNLLPSAEDCADCHAPEEIAASGYARPSLPESEWIFQFSHQKHLTTAGLDCGTCHGGIERADVPPSGHLPKMDLCLDCHHRREVSDDCVTCHYDVDLRRPADHVADYILDHAELARGDKRSCENCHTETYCQECHEGAALGLAIRGEEDAPADRIGPLATAHKGMDLLILQRTHDLNYRFTHGTDVRSKTSDCAICHEMPAFCGACHGLEGNADRLRPVWHGAPGAFDFTHADMARNDIEICAACHDVSATEPLCLRCHQSTVSPHPDDFLMDLEGDWHDNDDAVCYVCHVNSGHAGEGFCGRCHGGK